MEMAEKVTDSPTLHAFYLKSHFKEAPIRDSQELAKPLRVERDRLRHVKGLISHQRWFQTRALGTSWLPGRKGKLSPWSLVWILVVTKGEKMAWRQRKERQLVAWISRVCGWAEESLGSQAVSIEQLRAVSLDRGQPMRKSLNRSQR